MHQDEWARLKDLFLAAVERTGPDRVAFVAEACRVHPNLAARLRALLASHSQVETFLEPREHANEPVDSSGDDGTGILRPGDVVDDTYEVQSTLGAGGMGVVYRVVHRGLNRPFAAKVIHARVAADGRFVERFQREAVALGRLKHPHIVDVTDYGVERDGTGRPYLIMECLEGSTLAEQLSSGPLSTEAALPVFEGIAAALDYAHSQGVLHLDLKPANVSLHGGYGMPGVKILDFGLAHFTTVEGGISSEDSVLAGTPAYLAPERLDGAVPGPAADIYAFGVLMYETLTGRPPFEGSIAEVLHRQRNASPPRASSVNPAVAADLDDALSGILAKDPAARPPTARAALAGVRAALLRHQQRRWRRTEVPRRLLIATALGLSLGAISPPISAWSPMRRLELLTVDARFAASPSRAPSGNIVLLVLDDASLAADPTPLPPRADGFGRDLHRVLAAGARAVALDFLIPASWSESGPFTTLVLEHAERLTLAAYSSAAGELVGPESIAGVTTIALGPDRAAALFGFINLGEDEDGVARATRSFYRDREGGLRPAFAMRAVLTSELEGAPRGGPHADPFWIDHRIDTRRFARVSWKDLDAILRERPEVFRDRLVLAGADYAASNDERRVPGGSLPGVVLQGLIVNTILDEFPVRGVGRLGLILLSISASAFLASIALIFRAPVVAIAIVAASGVYTAVLSILFVRGGLMAPLVVPLFLAIVAAAAGLATRRRRRPYPILRDSG